MLGRHLANAMSANLGQPFVIENIGGGAGVPALNAVASAPPDGYTAFFCASGNITSQPLLTRNRVDILTQVEPVGMVATAPHVLVVSAKTPFKTVAELVAFARKNPGALNFASAGVGGLAHLGTEMFTRASGIEATHVPYKGAAPAMADLISGQVQAAFGTMPSFTGMIEKGAIRALGVTAASTSTPLKGLPLISTTIPGFAYTSWNALFVTARTPRPVVDRLFTAIQAAAASKELQKRFDEQGVDLAVSGPEELRATVRREIVLWDRVIRDAKIELN